MDQATEIMNGPLWLRERLGWTQAEMAEALKVTRQTVASYEQGRMRPTPDVAWQMVILSEGHRINMRLEDIYPRPVNVE